MSRFGVNSGLEAKAVRCFYCATKEGPFHRDHLVPISRGGRDSLWNIFMACDPCNRAKGNKLPSEWLGREIPWWVEDAEIICVARHENVDPRRKRGKPIPSKALLCWECDADLAQDLHSGWVVWFEEYARQDDASGIVTEFFVCCRGECADHILLRHSAPKYRKLDNHLPYFIGRRALVEFARLMVKYQWTDDARERCAEFFLLAGSMPTADDEGSAIHDQFTFRM